jgi:GAF domain-containing protein
MGGLGGASRTPPISAGPARASAGGPSALKAIARAAARTCEADDVLIFRLDGDRLRIVARHGRTRTVRKVGETWAISRGTVVGRAVVTRRSVHIRDLAVAVRREFKAATAIQRADGVRTVLAAPVLIEKSAAGAILIRRTRVRAFTRGEVALLRAFAAEAALAVHDGR